MVVRPECYSLNQTRDIKNLFKALDYSRQGWEEEDRAREPGIITEHYRCLDSAIGGLSVKWLKFMEMQLDFLCRNETKSLGKYHCRATIYSSDTNIFHALGSEEMYKCHKGCEKSLSILKKILEQSQKRIDGELREEETDLYISRTRHKKNHTKVGWT